MREFLAHAVAGLPLGLIRQAARLLESRLTSLQHGLSDPKQKVRIVINALGASKGCLMNVEMEVLRVLDEALSLSGRSAAFVRNTPLLGAIPELDSMAVVTILTALEEQLGITVDDDDIDGSTFATVGSLVDFVSDRLAS
jgi:acyl carrier protein